MTREEYASMLLPNCKHDRKYYEEKYKRRVLPDGAMVTRIGPSPTGFVHIGTLFQSVIATKLASQSGGVSYVRIEDTDQKREIENGKEAILKAVKDYDMPFNEGPSFGGDYAPYIQSERVDIYQAFAKDLIIRDLAYPSFITEEELTKLTDEQARLKQRIGYFGKWASKERSYTMEEVKEKIEQGIPYTIRLKSQGDFENKVFINDLIKGRVEFPENDMDSVILKSNGVPPYHFAHPVDDYLMGTTVVIRGEEWLSSVPLHLEIFKDLGIEPISYAHTASIQKEEDGKRRKISKRKDPEANVEYYTKMGIPKEAVKIYLLTLANSNFEEWYLANPGVSTDEFKMTFEKMSVSGALFDTEKLNNIAKTFLSSISAEDLTERILEWAKIYDTDFATILENNKDKAIAFLDIERHGNKPRKDIGMYCEARDTMMYMFDVPKNYDWQKVNDKSEISNILNTYINKYYDITDGDIWFSKVKEMCDELGYASDMKAYKQNPDNYKGNVADVSTVIRVAITGSSRTPNLYDIIKILGKEEVEKRINKLV